MLVTRYQRWSEHFNCKTLCPSKALACLYQHNAVRYTSK